MAMIRPRLRTFAVALGVALTPALAIPPLAAAPSSDETRGPYDAATQSELQGLITKQLGAFDRGDAAEAESLATPQFRDRYPDPASFFAMVKQNYAALLKPRSTHFDDVSDSPHGPLQKMTVVAADGTVWTVVYAFQRISGEWRISGCGMMRQDGQDI